MINASNSVSPSQTTLQNQQVLASPGAPPPANQIYDSNDVIGESKFVKAIRVLLWILCVIVGVQFFVVLALPHVITIASTFALGSGFFPLDYSLVLELVWGLLLLPLPILIQLMFLFLITKEIRNQTRISWLLAFITLIALPIFITLCINSLVYPMMDFTTNQGSDFGTGTALSGISSVSLNPYTLLSIITLLFLIIGWKKFSGKSRTYEFPLRGLITLFIVGLLLILVNTVAVIGQTKLSDKGKAYVVQEMGIVPLSPTKFPSDLQIERYYLEANDDSGLGEDARSVRTVISSPLAQTENRELIIVNEVATTPSFSFEQKVASIAEGEPGEVKTQIPISIAKNGAGYLITKPFGDREMIIILFELEHSVVTVISPSSSVENVRAVAENLVRISK